MKPIKFRKKTIVIEAINLDFENCEYVMNWANAIHLNPEFLPSGLLIKTLEGNMLAQIGDWIIKGVNGEFYPCKPDIFEKTYESMEE